MGNSSAVILSGEPPNQVIVSATPIRDEYDAPDKYRTLEASELIPFHRQKRVLGDKLSRYSSEGDVGGLVVLQAIGRDSDFPHP